MHLEQQQDKKRYLTSREVHADDTVVSVGDLSIGSDHSPVLIAGPCAIESAEQVEATASFLAQRGVRLFRGGAFKPRTDPYSFQGLGVEGLKIAREACDRHDLLFVSEIMDARDLPAFQEYADVLQVGARNMQNFTLLKAVGRSGKPVLLKRGLSATIEEWIMAAEYLLHESKPNIMLCERGTGTYSQFTRNTRDVLSVAVARLQTHLPVFVDVTHSG